MPYVDGFLLPLPKKNVQALPPHRAEGGQDLAQARRLEYRECVGDDLKPKWGALFPRTVRLKPGETVVFSWIVFRSRTHRDSVNKKVMKDPRMLKMMEEGPMPFDHKRMAYGGFKVIVDL